MSVNDVEYFDGIKWIRITIEKARSLVAPKSYEYRCRKCCEPVVFSEGEIYQSHFKHKKGPDECKDKLTAESNGYGPNTSKISYLCEIDEVPLKIGNINNKSITFEVEIKKSFIDNNVKFTPKEITVSSSDLKYKRMFEWEIATDSSKCFTLDESQALNEYIITFSAGKYNERHFKFLGIKNLGAIFTDSKNPRKIQYSRKEFLNVGDTYLFLIKNSCQLLSKLEGYEYVFKNAEWVIVKVILSDSPLIHDIICQLGYDNFGYRYIKKFILIFPPFTQYICKDTSLNVRIQGNEIALLHYEVVHGSSQNFSLKECSISQHTVNSFDNRLSIKKVNTLNKDIQARSLAVFDDLNNTQIAPGYCSKIPKGSTISFTPDYDGVYEVYKDNYLLVRGEFKAERTTYISKNNYIEFGNSINIYYGTDCIWNVSFLEEDQTQYFNSKSMSLLARYLTLHTSDMVRFDTNDSHILAKFKGTDDVYRLLKQAMRNGFIQRTALVLMRSIIRKGYKV